MERWALRMIRHRWVVVAVWVAVLLVSAVAASGLSKLLTNRFSIPGSDTARAEKILHDHFGQRSDGSFQLVYQANQGHTAAEARAGAGACREESCGAGPDRTPRPARAVSERTATATVTSALEPADAKNYTDRVRAAAGQIPNGQLYVTGAAAITKDTDEVFARDAKVGELYTAIPIALAILVFVFGTFAFLLPMLFAAAAIPATLAIIWVLAHFMELSTYLQNMVALIGLGIAIDYSLLVVYRYREERAQGRHQRGCDRPHDVDCGARGRLQRHRGRDRARAHARDAAPVHAGLRPRRARDPDGLDRLCPDALARPPLSVRGRPRPGARDPEVGRPSGAPTRRTTCGRVLLGRSCGGRCPSRSGRRILIAAAIPVFSLEVGPGRTRGSRRTCRACRA